MHMVQYTYCMFMLKLMTLTVSHGVKGPLVIFEERVSLDFLHAISAQSHLPQNKGRE